MKTPIEEPYILTANCHYWRSNSSADGRRHNERRRLTEVKDYLCALGFACTDGVDCVVGVKDAVRVVFSYNESCTRVYKSLCITQGGKRSNITLLRKMQEEPNKETN